VAATALRWPGLLAGLAWAGLAAGSAFAAPAPCTGTQAVAEAQRRVLSADGTPAGPASEQVSVPDRLPLALRSENLRIRYEIDVSACAQVPAAALWIFRAGAPYRVEAGGTPLRLLSANQRAQTGAGGEASEPDSSYNGRIPALFALPAGTTRVSIELQTLPYIATGLVQLALGPTHALLPQHTNAVRDVVGYADAASGVVLVLGLMALLLWLPRRRDLNLLWLAAACGLWGVRGLIYYDNTVPGRPLVYEQLNAVNALLAAATITAAVLHLLRFSKRFYLSVLAAVTLLALVGFGAAELAQRGAIVARSLAQIAGTGMICWLGVAIWRRRQLLAPRHAAALLACLVVLVSCVVHDLMVVSGALPPASNAWVFWGFVAVLVGYALMSGEYVVMTLSRAERSNEELERRVAAKSGELERSYTQLRKTEIASARETARAQERERLLREMHDGLGAQLMTALRGVERGALSREQLAQSLQDGLDELRLLMDSTDGTSHYLPAALAAWRNRWDARLAAAGVLLEWQMDDSLEQLNLGSEAALHVMRILQEATTNVVKHSRAQSMTLRAGVYPGTDGTPLLQIEIADDGAGLAGEAARSGARGLKNMAYRAGQIGAQLAVVNRALPATGCMVRLVLPLAD
jgi:signal transduction histidine kinase